jgi:hypothetical protein
MPPTKINSSWVAFAGTVVNYSISGGEVLKQQRVPAVVVRVTEPLLSVHLGDQFDIFVFGVATDCHPISQAIQDLMEQYPRGSTVTIVASASVSSVAGEHQSIITSVDDWGSLARLPSAIPRRPSGLLDFREFATLYEDHPGGSFSIEIAWRNTHRSWFEDYEYLRALMYLAQQSSPLLRASILDDLRSYTRWRKIASAYARESYEELVVAAGIPSPGCEQLVERMSTQQSQ